MIHKIPITAVIAAFLFHSSYGKAQIIGFLVMFSAMTPLGTYISNNTVLATEYIDIVNAVVIGIFLHIATTILFETGEGHTINISKLAAICLGIFIAYFV